MNHADEKKGKWRLLSTETGLGSVGLACAVNGIADGAMMPIFYGLCIICGAVVLHFVRKKDWEAHWEQHARIRDAYERRMAEEREEKSKAG